jgi:hypothetical protein
MVVHACHPSNNGKCKIGELRTRLTWAKSKTLTQKKEEPHDVHWNPHQNYKEYHHRTIRVTIIKTAEKGGGLQKKKQWKMTSAGEDMEKLTHLYSTWK